MRLVGQLSSSLPRLQRVLDLPDTPRARPRAPAPPERGSRRLGNGVVQRAVVKVLATADRPLSLADVRPAVEGLLGHSVSEYSVSCCLAAGARASQPCFERVARGHYRLLPTG
jgi:hypothetical protein